MSSIVNKILFPVYGDLRELKSVIFILLSMCDFFAIISLLMCDFFAFVLRMKAP